ncbi:MAG: glycosyltransferase family 39 protein, partial [bacterium]|nr:glycosyltransferase family 39 protein [bacterium]
MVDIKSNYSRLFWISITCSLILKFFLAYFFPLTGDEAYFITSGKFFDLGYYEHPPLIWWIIYISSFFGRYTFHFFYYRLFSIFTTLLIGYLIFILLKTEEEKRYLISSFFLLSPVYLLSFLITNDIPLLFFTFLSGIFFYKGIKEERKIDFIISGTFFGLAFLSKYLSILYLIGVFVYVTLRNEKKLWKNFFVFFAFSLPLIFINLYWNYTHCWINV